MDKLVSLEILTKKPSTSISGGSSLAVLGVAKLDWVKWAKFQIKFQALLFAVASIFIVVGVLIGF